MGWYNRLKLFAAQRTDITPLVTQVSSVKTTSHDNTLDKCLPRVDPVVEKQVTVTQTFLDLEKGK